MTRSVTRPAIFGVVASLFLTASAAAQSQPQRDEGIGLGVKGGYLGSTFNYDANQELFDGQGGWLLGVFGGGNRPGRFGFQGEINLLKKSTLCGCNRQQVDPSYLQIPGLARVNLGERPASGARLYGLAGPALEFKVAEKLGSHIISEYSGFDVSIVTGGGVEYKRFVGEARVSWGLRNLGKDLPENVKVTSRTFMILGGVRFN